MEGKKITSVSIKSGDSGYEVECCYMEKSEGGGQYESMMTRHKDFYFSEGESKEAFNKFLEMDKMKKKKGDY